MKTRLIVVRHAHRVRLLGGSADNGLSPRGKKQARNLTEVLTQVYGKKVLKRAQFFSSPKVRCVETLGPLVQRRGGKSALEIDLDLNEGMSRMRAKRFLKKWSRALLSKQASNPLWVICTHGDWIPEFFKQLTGARVELKKGAWVEVEIAAPKAKLTFY